jgi:hypothetical protein
MANYFDTKPKTTLLIVPTQKRHSNEWHPFRRRRGTVHIIRAEVGRP